MEDNIKKKVCPECLVEYSHTTKYFYKRGGKSKKTGEDFLCYYCKNCQKLKRKKYGEDNRDKINRVSRNHYKLGIYSESKKEYRQKHNKEIKEWLKEWRYENREKIKEQAKKWKELNKEKRRLWINNYVSEKYKNDIGYRLIKLMRSRIRKKVKSQNANKSEKTIHLLGCSIEYFKLYLESKFTEGMTWGNYGIHGWHIDHIKPCAAFDLSKPEQQSECFNYRNLQPLWGIENLKKTSFYNGKKYQMGKIIS